MKYERLDMTPLYKRRRQEVDLVRFMTVYSSIESVSNAINNLNFMSGIAAIFSNHFSSYDAANILNSGYLTAAKAAEIVGSSKYVADKVADAFNQSELTAANAASIVNDTLVRADKFEAIFESANISDTRVRAIIDHANRTRHVHVWISNGCGDMTNTRDGLAAAGTQIAGLAFGGYDGSRFVETEEYNGAAWSDGGDLSVAHSLLDYAVVDGSAHIQQLLKSIMVRRGQQEVLSIQRYTNTLRQAHRVQHCRLVDMMERIRQRLKRIMVQHGLI